MWLIMNNSFISVVRPIDHEGYLLVRSRRFDDLQAIFPGVDIIKTEGRDYLYRAHIPVQEVASAIASKIAGIDYGNFKDSVGEDQRHRIYSRVWAVSRDLQDK